MRLTCIHDQKLFTKDSHYIVETLNTTIKPIHQGEKPAKNYRMVTFKNALCLAMLILLFRPTSGLDFFTKPPGSFTFELQKVHVYLLNIINIWQEYHPDLHIHCKSHDDDLRQQMIQYGTQYEIKFKVNLFGTTYFKCDLWWIDIEGANNTIQNFNLYDYEVHWDKCDHNDCWWTARETGLYFTEHASTNHGLKLFAKWKRGKPDQKRRFWPPKPAS